MTGGLLRYVFANWLCTRSQEFQSELRTTAARVSERLDHLSGGPVAGAVASTQLVDVIGYRYGGADPVDATHYDPEDIEAREYAEHFKSLRRKLYRGELPDLIRQLYANPSRR